MDAHARQASLTVVIPTLRRYSWLSRVLDGLERQTADPRRFEVLVVADAAEPDPERVDGSLSGRTLEARRLKAELPGASAARNAGWREARGELVLFLDDDIVPAESLIAEHLAWHERFGGLSTGVIGHVRWAPELTVTPFMRWLEHGVQFDFPSIRGIEAGWGRFYTANASVRRDLLELVGGFDEVRLPYLYEDLDLALRARDHGFRVLYNRSAVGFHLHETDLDQWRGRVGVLAAAERAFCEKHPEIPPYFHRMFSAASARRPARGRLAPLVRHVPRRTPVLGEAIWRSADAYFTQALADGFLRAWDEAGAQR